MFRDVRLAWKIISMKGALTKPEDRVCMSDGSAITQDRRAIAFKCKYAGHYSFLPTSFRSRAPLQVR